MIFSSWNRPARATDAALATPAREVRRVAWPGCLSVLALLVMAPPLAAVEMAALPSGQQVTLAEVLLDQAPGELWVHFRFVAPAISRDGGWVNSEQAGPDMDHLCDTLVLPYLTTRAITPARVVISLMDRSVVYGAKDPEATQFFEAYRLDGAGCIWEGF